MGGFLPSHFYKETDMSKSFDRKFINDKVYSKTKQLIDYLDDNQEIDIKKMKDVDIKLDEIWNLIDRRKIKRNVH